MIAVCSKIVKNTEDQETKKLAREIIASEKNTIKQTYADLKEMQRWKKRKEQNEPEHRLLEKKIST